MKKIIAIYLAIAGLAILLSLGCYAAITFVIVKTLKSMGVL